MCGIAGMAGGRGDVGRALHTFAYRGPDAEGSFSDGAVALGQVRLSIIDLDPRSNQPLFDTTGDTGIVFNGEIYNYRELREELERVHGARFRSQSDTEVLVEGYRAWGTDMLPRLRGMFAFAIYDKPQRTILLARDHAGIKPLYYAVHEGKLLFASEAKGVAALLREQGAEPTLSDDAIGLYLAFGYVPSPLTPVKEIVKVPRGSYMRFDIAQQRAEIVPWKLEQYDVSDGAGLQRVVRESILEHTIADVPVGVFFSGGIDSSVVALALRDAGMDLATYSVRVAGKAADEPYFRDIASKLGVKARIVDFGLTEFERMFEHVLARMDDPIADPSIFPTALVSVVASEDVKVVLSGEGGDELFLGYPRALRLVHMQRQRRGGDIAAPLAALPPFRGKRALYARIAAAAGNPEAFYLSQTSLAFDRTPVHAWRSAIRLMRETDSLWFDRDWYLENMLMRKADMATMYASIEGRVPLLGARLWSAAPTFAQANMRGAGKRLLREMLYEALPRELVDRPKSGFGIPLSSLAQQSVLLREASAAAAHSLRATGLPVFRAIPDADHVLAYPSLAYGLVALHRSLKNLGLL